MKNRAWKCTVKLYWEISDFVERAIPGFYFGYLRNFEISWQRFWWGYAPDDFYNINSFVLTHIPKLLDLWGDSPAGHPMELTYEEWQDILRRIRLGFRAWEILEEDVDCWSDQERMAKLRQRMEEGLELFAKWLPNLWD